MIKKILIANRSEIACRIIKTCRALGIETVAVYSDADTNALHKQLADEAYYIGESEAVKSYLNMEKIIKAALETNCDAIHPGYGFLSENHVFNRKVRQYGLIFIGPSPEPMELLGSKTEARKLMEANGIPVVPGALIHGEDTEKVIEIATQIGYPVLIKAAAGGGGKGMRVVNGVSDLINSIEAAQRESLAAFGSDEVFIEKYIENPRHIEFQVAADSHGNVIHLFERECSIQRRHQKIIEETPSTALNPEIRAKMGEIAKKVCTISGYDNIGTVEFLFDDTGNFYFLEVNARIQVEHPITEETTDIDLVKLQIDIADGLELPFRQEDLSQKGHAIECRIYAEDGENNFLPSIGKILEFVQPYGTGNRYDSGVDYQSEITVFYDPIMAKLIVWGDNREVARKKMIRALKDNVILGVKTSINFMIACLESDDFIKGKTYTSFIDNNIESLKNYREETLLFPALAVAHSKMLSDINDTKEENELFIKSNIWQEIGSWEICSSYKV